MRELLLDVIKHTQGLGFLDTVKVDGTETETQFVSSMSNHTVILNATALKAEPELAGSFGMGRLGILQGYLNFANYRTDDAKIDITRSERNGIETPEEIVFNDGHGQKSVYRFMSADLIKNAQFKGKSWDVSIEPSNSKIKEFQELASILSSTDPYFLVKIEDGNLKFTIGDEAADRAEITIAEDIDGDLKGELYWPVAEVLAILKLGMNETPKIDINSKGALQITLTSKQAEYKFILPARRR